MHASCGNASTRVSRMIIILFLYTCCTAVICTQFARHSSGGDPKLYMVDDGELVQIDQKGSPLNDSALLSLNMRFHIPGGKCNHDDDCLDPEEICVHQSCICQEFFQYDMSMRCVPCPGLGSRCNGCCSHVSLYCVHRVCKCIDESCQEPQGVFVTASQVALTAALIMGFAALAMVVYRLCTRSRYLTARQRTAERSAENVSYGQTSFLRASLTSMQIRVLSRLRDRPPAYENQATTRQEVAPPGLVPSSEAPPAYVESRASNTHQPPPYSEIVLAPGEFINNAYVETENCVSEEPNNETSDTPKVLIVSSDTK